MPPLGATLIWIMSAFNVAVDLDFDTPVDLDFDTHLPTTLPNGSLGHGGPLQITMSSIPGAGLGLRGANNVPQNIGEVFFGLGTLISEKRKEELAHSDPVTHTHTRTVRRRSFA